MSQVPVSRYVNCCSRAYPKALLMKNTQSCKLYYECVAAETVTSHRARVSGSRPNKRAHADVILRS